MSSGMDYMEMDPADALLSVCNVEDINSIIEMFHIEDALLKEEMTAKFFTCKQLSSVYFTNQFVKQNAYEVLENMFKYFSNLSDVIFDKLSSIQEVENTQLYEILKVAIQLIECIKTILKMLCKAGSVKLAEIKLVALPTLHVVTKAYEHFKNSQLIYGDRFSDVNELLRKLFQEIYPAQTALHFLNLKLDCNLLTKDDRLFVAEVCKMMLNISCIISDLDRKSLTHTWKFMVQYIWKFKPVFKDSVQVDQYLKVLCELINKKLKECVEIFQSLSPQESCHESANEELTYLYKQTQFFSQTLTILIDVTTPPKNDIKIFLDFLLELFSTLLPVIKVPITDCTTQDLRVAIIGQILSEQSGCLCVLQHVDGLWDSILELVYPDKVTGLLFWMFMSHTFSTQNNGLSSIPLFDKNSEANLCEKLVESFVEAYPHTRDTSCIKLFHFANNQQNALSSFHDITVNLLCNLQSHSTGEQLMNVLCYFAKFLDQSLPVQACLAFDVITSLSLQNPKDIGMNMMEQALDVLNHADCGSKAFLQPMYLNFCNVIEVILPCFSVQQLTNIQSVISTHNRSMADCYLSCIKVIISPNSLTEINALATYLTKNMITLTTEIKNIKDLYSLLQSMAKFKAILSIVETCDKFGDNSGVTTSCKKIHVQLKHSKAMPEFTTALCNFWNKLLMNFITEFVNSIVFNEFQILVVEIICTILSCFYTPIIVEQTLATCEMLLNCFQEDLYKIFICQILLKFASNQLTHNSEQSVVKLYSTLLASTNFYVQQSALKSFEEFSKSTPNAHIIKECVKDPQVQNKVRNYLQRIVQKPLNECHRIDMLEKEISRKLHTQNIYIDFLKTFETKKTTNSTHHKNVQNTDHAKLVFENFHRATSELNEFVSSSRSFKLPQELKSKYLVAIDTIDRTKKLLQ